MKKLFISMLAVAALVSCSKEQTIVADQGELIGFNSFVENSTRATVDPSYGQGAQNLTEFQVWGTVDASNGNPVAIYANDTVTGTAVGASNIWNCTTKTQYWIKDAKYNFAALVHAGNVTLGADLLPAIVEFTATTGSTDLMYARSTNDIVGQESGENDPVNFNFSHLLSKVYIGVTNNSSSATGYSFLVKNIKINAPKTDGKYYIQDVVEDDKTISAGTWTATTGEYTFANISVTGATAECAAEQLLIPGNATVSFDVDIIYNNATITTKQYSKAVTLAAGNAYKFNILASVGEEIKFSVENQPTWSNQPAIDLN